MEIYICKDIIEDALKSEVLAGMMREKIMRSSNVHHSEKRKHICIIRSNPVRPDSRVEKESRALQKAGYSVHILAWDRDSDHSPETSMVCGSIPITRFGYKAGYSMGIKSIIPRLGFQLSIVKWFHTNGSRFDAVHACDIDTAMFAYLFARIRRCKFVFDIFDFMYAKPMSLFQKAIRASQLLLIDHADATIICTEQRKEQIKGSKPRKLVIIHNTPDAELIETDQSVRIDQNRLSVAYIGVLTKDRLLREIINFFKKNPEVDFYIGGFGILEKEIKSASQEYANIHFVGRIPYEQTIAIESQCDVMVACYDVTIENNRMAAPNKFYESLMLGKPIIMTKGMGMADEIKKEDIGVLIDYSEDSFAGGINNLVSRKDEWPEMSKRARKLYEEKYSWDKMKKRLVSMYRNVLGT